MGEIDVGEIAIEWTRQIIGASRSSLVPAAVREKEFVLGAPILVDAEGHGSVPALLAREVDKVIRQTSLGIRRDGQVAQNLFRNWVKHRGGNNIAGEGYAAADETCRTGSGVWIEDLPLYHGSIVAGIDGTGSLPQQCREVAVL